MAGRHLPAGSEHELPHQGVTVRFAVPAQDSDLFPAQRVLHDLRRSSLPAINKSGESRGADARSAGFSGGDASRPTTPFSLVTSSRRPDHGKLGGRPGTPNRRCGLVRLSTSPMHGSQLGSATRGPVSRSVGITTDILNGGLSAFKAQREARQGVGQEEAGGGRVVFGPGEADGAVLALVAEAHALIAAGWLGATRFTICHLDTVSRRRSCCSKASIRLVSAKKSSWRTILPQRVARYNMVRLL